MLLQKKTFRIVERWVRGFANHRRIEIMELLFRHPESSLSEIADKGNINFKTAGEHMRRLVQAGLVMKRSEGAAVRHRLTGRGIRVLRFLKTLE